MKHSTIQRLTKQNLPALLLKPKKKKKSTFLFLDSNIKPNRNNYSEHLPNKYIPSRFQELTIKQGFRAPALVTF